jgi:hypothetical protein
VNKLIIDNRTDLSDFDALVAVINVVWDGRISNDGKQYCYLTSMPINEKQYVVSTDLNKKSERFVIMEDRR